MKLTIDNQLVTLAVLREAWRHACTVELGNEARGRIASSNELVREVVAGGEQVYGVNTGFGQLADVRIDKDELAHLQENLVRSHAVGVGDDLDVLRASEGLAEGRQEPLGEHAAEGGHQGPRGLFRHPVQVEPLAHHAVGVEA